MQALNVVALHCMVIGLTTLAADLNGEWRRLQPSGTPPTPAYYAAAVLDEPGSAMLVFGGRADNFVLQGDLHRYDLQADAWSLLSPSGPPPPARQGSKMVFDAATRTVLLFGGSTNWVYRYDVQANHWSPLSFRGTPPSARVGFGAVFDAAMRRMLIFAGCSHGQLFNDLWSYDVQTGAWSDLSPTGSVPAKRCYSSAELDPTSRIMLVFGGFDMLDDLHSYDLQANAWSVLSPSGRVPSPRQSHTTVWLGGGSKTMLLFGGVGGTSLFADVLGYDVQANEWKAVSFTGIPPSARSTHIAVFDNASRTMLVHGGFDGRAQNDVYALQMGTAEISTVTTSSATTSTATTSTATTSTATTSTATTSTATTGTATTIAFSATTSTATTKTTTTTIVCGPGSELSSEGEACQACSPGRFAAVQRQPCDACASGHDSEAGSSACQPTLSHVVASLAVPVLTISRVSSSVTTLRLDLAVLPPAVFNGVGLSYAIDIAATADALSTQSACAAKWEISRGTASIRLAHADLSYPCSTKRTSTIRRDGVLGTHLVEEDGLGSRTVFRWVQDITLTFSPFTDIVTTLLMLGDRAFQVGAFPSTLRLFTSNNFSTVRRTPFLLSDEVVPVEHALGDNQAVVNMILVMAWLSRSSNVSDLEAVQHNATLAFEQHEGGVGLLRYSFSAKPCQSCYLHSLSKVTFRVDDHESHESFAVVQSLYLEVTASVQPPVLPPDDDFPEVFLGPATALLLPAFVAVVTGVVAGLQGCRLKHKMPGAANMQAFFVLGFCDCLSDVVVVVMARAPGDLRFSDDGGAIFAVLSTCVGLSIFLLFIEVGFWKRWGKRLSEVQKKTIHTTLACTHLAVEDCFQTGLFAFVTASHARSGLGLRASTSVAMLKAAVFTVVKIAEVAGLWVHCSKALTEAENPAASEAENPATSAEVERVCL